MTSIKMNLLTKTSSLADFLSMTCLLMTILSMRHFMIKKKTQKKSMVIWIIILLYGGSCLGNYGTDLMSVHHLSEGWVVVEVTAWRGEARCEWTCDG